MKKVSIFFSFVPLDSRSDWWHLLCSVLQSGLAYHLGYGGSGAVWSADSQAAVG